MRNDIYKQNHGKNGLRSAKIKQSGFLHSDHPHVVKVHGVASGEPIILGTRIMVRTIVEQYQLGSSVEEILGDFPQLSSAQVHDALAYYHDHKEEMDELLEQATYEYWQPIIERMMHERTQDLS